jgi:hypothetical protein
MTKEAALLVDEGIKLNQQIKQSTKRLDQIKAELTKCAFNEMENKNLKYLQIFGTAGCFNTAYKEKFEVDNYQGIIALLGEVAAAKITRKEEIKYNVETRFKAALIAVCRDNYSNEMTVESILKGLDLDANAIKIAKKKLKGDYLTDKKVLESLGVTGEREEELDAIRLAKNYELVQRFCGSLSPEQIETLKKTIYVEEQLSVGFDYQDEQDTESE